jgi:hypothetical protein
MPRKYLPITDAEVLELFRQGVYAVNLDDGTITNGGGKVLPTFLCGKSKINCVRLYSGKARRGISVSRVVWMVGCDMVVPEGFQIHHDDEIQDNDAFENLFALSKPDHLKKHRTKGYVHVPF